MFMRVDKIFVKLDSNSRITFERIEEILEENLKKVASSTKYAISHDEMQIEVDLHKPISIPTAYKILRAFDDKRLRVLEVNWRRTEFGALIRGYLEILVY